MTRSRRNGALKTVQYKIAGESSSNRKQRVLTNKIGNCALDSQVVHCELGRPHARRARWASPTKFIRKHDRMRWTTGVVALM